MSVSNLTFIYVIQGPTVVGCLILWLQIGIEFRELYICGSPMSILITNIKVLSSQGQSRSAKLVKKLFLTWFLKPESSARLAWQKNRFGSACQKGHSNTSLGITYFS